MGNASLPDSCEVNTKRRKITRILLVIAGTISLVLGAIGIVLPILPTTPFLLLSAACYCRSSERMYRWLIGNRWFGDYIKNYRAGKGIPMKTKVLALSVLWGTIIVSSIFLGNIIIAIVLFAVAAGVSIHILRLPTYKKN